VVEARKPDEFLGRCPLGLERNPQGLDVILRRLDMPRGEIPTKLFFALLEGRTVGTPLETQVKILGYVKDVYGDKAGQLFPLAVHLKRRGSTKEDTRAKLSCTGDCDSCKLPVDASLKSDIRTIRKLILLVGTGEEEAVYY
jgi:hypothetical protein